MTIMGGSGSAGGGITTEANGSTSSLVAITGALNLGTSGSHLGLSNLMNINLVDTTGSSLQVGTNYTINLASASSFTLNGTAQAANAPIDSGTTLTNGSGTGSVSNLSINNSTYAASITSWSVQIDSTGSFLTLTLQSAAAPEPHHIMLICVTALLIGLRVRRWWTKRIVEAA